MKILRLHYIYHISVLYRCHSFFWFHKIRPNISVPWMTGWDPRWWIPRWRKWKEKKLKKFKPWNGKYFNILSKFEGWGPTSCLYIKKKRSVFPNYFRLRTEGVLPAPASQSLIYLWNIDAATRVLLCISNVYKRKTPSKCPFPQITTARTEIQGNDQHFEPNV